MDFENKDLAGFLSGSTGMFDIGETIGGHYEIVEMLGEGMHAEVYKVYNKSDENHYVVKVPKDGNSSMQFQREIRILNKLSKLRTPSTLVRPHPSITHAEEPCIMLEYLEGSTLQEYLKQKEGQITTRQAKRIIRDILEALACLHAEGIVHGDVKPENIKITNEKAVLFDFSVAKDLQEPSQHDECSGTIGYMPPDDKVSCAWDIYSVGILLHLLLRGRLPSWDIGNTQPVGPHDQLLLPKKFESNLTLNGVLIGSLSYSPEKRYKDARSMRKAFRWLPTFRPSLYLFDYALRHYTIRCVAFIALTALASLQGYNLINQALKPTEEVEELTSSVEVEAPEESSQILLQTIKEKYALNHYRQKALIEDRLEGLVEEANIIPLKAALSELRTTKDLLNHPSGIQLQFYKLTILSDTRYPAFQVRVTFDQLAEGASYNFKQVLHAGDINEAYLWQPNNYLNVSGIRNNSRGKVHLEALTGIFGEDVDLSYQFNGPYDLQPFDTDGWIEWPEYGIKLRIDAKYNLSEF